MYNASLQAHLKGFNQTLSIFPCGIPDQGGYSSVRTCSDCLAAYTTWLCSIVMPRCTDLPSPATINNTVPLRIGYNDQPVAVDFSTTLIRSNPLLSRTPQFGSQQLQANNQLAQFSPTTPFPYAEIPPCGIVCHSVFASCPMLIDWTCPLEEVSMAAGYGMMREMDQDELQGGDEGLWADDETQRGADRFGNVWCNALEVDVLVQKRRN